MGDTRNTRAKATKPSSSLATTSKDTGAKGKGKAPEKPTKRKAPEKVVGPERQEQAQAQVAPPSEPPVDWNTAEQEAYRDF